MIIFDGCIPLPIRNNNKNYKIIDKMNNICPAILLKETKKYAKNQFFDPNNALATFCGPFLCVFFLVCM